MVGLEDVHGARFAPAGEGVDEHQRVPSIEQVVGQVHTSNAVVDQVNARLRRMGLTQYLGAETVVSEEDVADPGYQNSWRDRRLRHIRRMRR